MKPHKDILTLDRPDVIPISAGKAPPAPLPAAPRTPTLPKVEQVTFEKYIGEMPTLNLGSLIGRLQSENPGIMVAMSLFQQSIPSRCAPGSSILGPDGKPAGAPSQAMTIEAASQLVVEVGVTIYELLAAQLMKDSHVVK